MVAATAAVRGSAGVAGAVGQRWDRVAPILGKRTARRKSSTVNGGFVRQKSREGGAEAMAQIMPSVEDRVEPLLGKRTVRQKSKETVIAMEPVQRCISTLVALPSEELSTSPSELASGQLRRVGSISMPSRFSPFSPRESGSSPSSGAAAASKPRRRIVVSGHSDERSSPTGMPFSVDAAHGHATLGPGASVVRTDEAWSSASRARGTSEVISFAVSLTEALKRVAAVRSAAASATAAGEAKEKSSSEFSPDGWQCFLRPPPRPPPPSPRPSGIACEFSPRPAPVSPALAPLAPTAPPSERLAEHVYCAPLAPRARGGRKQTRRHRHAARGGGVRSRQAADAASPSPSPGAAGRQVEEMPGQPDAPPRRPPDNDDSDDGLAALVQAA